MNDFTLNLTLLLAARALDLATTYLVSPDLRKELNPVIRFLGWRWTILLNIALMPLFADSRSATLIVALASLAAAGWNLLNVVDP